MDVAEKLSITLPAALARLIRAKVAEGAYASNSEVIRDALRLWQEREDARAGRLARVRRELDEAIDDPRPLVPAEEAFASLRQLHKGLKRKMS